MMIEEVLTVIRDVKVNIFLLNNPCVSPNIRDIIFDTVKKSAKNKTSAENQEILINVMTETVERNIDQTFEA